MPRILILPGLYDSPPEHWQSLWTRELADALRVEQEDWNTPSRTDWVARLETAVAEAGEETILVAHSLASVLVAHWAGQTSQRVKGALLVAPSDTEAETFPPGTTGFTPIPLHKLSFPTIVVASTDDVYITPERATALAKAWGAELVWLENAGHISTDNGFGPWPEGLELLERLVGTPLARR